MRRQRKSKGSLLILVPLALFAIVLGAASVVNLINAVISTPTLKPANKVSPLELTLEAIGLSQTAVSLPTETPTNTATDTPVPTVAATNTLELTSTFTSVPSATFIPYVPPTETFIPYVQPTQPQQLGGCSCSGDSYNCGDFGSQSSAQSCFNSCMNAGAGDIHKLDGNNDGVACESLP